MLITSCTATEPQYMEVDTEVKNEQIKVSSPSSNMELSLPKLDLKNKYHKYDETLKTSFYHGTKSKLGVIARFAKEKEYKGAKDYWHANQKKWKLKQKPSNVTFIKIKAWDVVTYNFKSIVCNQLNAKAYYHNDNTLVELSFLTGCNSKGETADVLGYIKEISIDSKANNSLKQDK